MLYRKMLVIRFLVTGLASVLCTTEPPQTWVNQHPELEQIIADSVKVSIDVFDKNLKDTIDVPDFHYRGNNQRQFNGWLGELRKLKSIAHVSGTNVTWINKDQRRLSFFVRLRVMQVTYHAYNQSGFDFYKEGKIVVKPETNLIRIECEVSRETPPCVESYVLADNATLVHVGKPTVHVSPRGDPDNSKPLNLNVVEEIIQPLLDTIGTVFLHHVRQGVNEALQRKGLLKFYIEYFSKNHTSDEQYRV